MFLTNLCNANYDFNYYVVVYFNELLCVNPQLAHIPIANLKPFLKCFMSIRWSQPWRFDTLNCHLASTNNDMDLSFIIVIHYGI